MTTPRPCGAVARISAAEAAALGSALHAKLGGRPVLLDLGTAVAELLPAGAPHPGPEAAQELLKKLAEVRLDLRPASDVARGGGYFRSGGQRRPSVAEWRRGAGNALAFDTRRGSELNVGLRAALPSGGSPPALRLWSRSPVASLGRAASPPESAEELGGAGDKESSGLSFHRHERNWLFLLSGRKRWYFHIGAAPPVTALERVDEEDLLRRESEKRGGSAPSVSTAPITEPDGELLTHDQLPGECLLLPDGVWHSTYNLFEQQGPDEVVIAFGGMGACASKLHLAAAEGDLRVLAAAPRQELEEQAPTLARVAVEQAQLGVLERLGEILGPDIWQVSYDKGVTLMHLSAGAGDAGIAAWLLKNGAAAEARDAAGAMPAHWVQLSGSAEVLAALQEAGADLSVADARGGCQPLHYLAGKGHAEAVRWAVDTGGADVSAVDARGLRPEAWAAFGGHTELAAWLRSRRQQGQMRRLRLVATAAGVAALLSLGAAYAVAVTSSPVLRGAGDHWEE